MTDEKELKAELIILGKCIGCDISAVVNAHHRLKLSPPEKILSALVDMQAQVVVSYAKAGRHHELGISMGARLARRIEEYGKAKAVEKATEMDFASHHEAGHA